MNQISEAIHNVSAPRRVHLVLTTKCNWSCVFCSVCENPGVIYRSEKVKRILDTLAEAGVHEITLYGGEPTLHPDFTEIGKYAKDLGLSVGFVSNGLGITRSSIDKVINSFDSGSISIHGFRHVHERITQTQGSYGQALNAIKLLASEDFELGVCVTVCTLNLFNFDRFVRYLYSQFPNIRAFAISRAKYTGAGKEYCLNRSEVIELVRRIDLLNKSEIPIILGVSIPPCILPEDLRRYARFCTAGIEFCNIDGEGNVRICQSLSKSPTLGNIFNKSLDDIWNCEDILKFRMFEWIDKRCKNCHMFRVCFGGCKASPTGNYCTDSIIYEDYAEYFYSREFRIRVIDGRKVVSAPHSFSVVLDDDILEILKAIKQKPRTLGDIIYYLKLANIHVDEKELRDVLDKLIQAGLVLKVYRDTIENYIL